jgi:predicted small lipoprotein YifL
VRIPMTLLVLTLAACGDKEDPPADDSQVADSDRQDTADTADTADTGEIETPDWTYDPGAVDIFVDMTLQTEPERPWRVDVRLHGDGLFSERFASAEVRLATPKAKSESFDVTGSLKLESIQDDYVGETALSPGDGAGLVFTPTVHEGEVVSWTQTEALEAADCSGATCTLALQGSQDMGGAYMPYSVSTGIDTSAGELHLRMSGQATSGAPYLALGYRADKDNLGLDTQTMAWVSGTDLPAYQMIDGTEMTVTLTVFDKAGTPVGEATTQAMYGDILMGSLPLDDFFD